MRKLKWNGSSWSAQPSGTTQRLNGIWGTSATSLWAVGDSGTILRYDGTTWTVSSGPVGGTVNLTGVWGTSASDVWAVGLNATILH